MNGYHSDRCVCEVSYGNEMRERERWVGVWGWREKME